jgi:2-polyprenyl-3-methyl-5-hydroxy-6-metoxy-1,4-benzoquinol methylase
MAYQCNTCGSENSQELFHIGKHSVVQCVDCNLTYIANPMSPQETKLYYEQGCYNTQNGTASAYGQGEQFRIKEAKDRLSKIGPIGSLLDVGCGMGFFVKVCSERGIKAVGIDLSQNAVNYGQSHGLDLRQGDLLYLDDFADESFDAVTFWASIEHLYLPKETLQKAHRILRPNGLVVLETGDFNSYLARLCKGNWRIVQPSHNFYFSSATLDGLLGRTGFEVFQTDNDGFVESMITQLGLREFALNSFNEISVDSRERSSSLKERINGIAGRLHLGDVMIKYARKKA